MRSAIFLTAVGLALALTGCQDETSVQTSAPPPPAPPSSSLSTAAPAPTTPAGTPKTVEAAIQRFEKYLRGVGNQDLDVVCDVAGPGAKKAEAQGFGTCRQTFPITFQMLGATKRTALQTATVDAKQVRQRTNGDVDIPAKAIRASVPIGERDLGDAVLSYRDGTWFVID